MLRSYVSQPCLYRRSFLDLHRAGRPYAKAADSASHYHPPRPDCSARAVRGRHAERQPGGGRAAARAGGHRRGGAPLQRIPRGRTGRDLDLWVMDPSDPASDRMVLQLQGGGYGPLDWSPDDRTILLAQYVSVNESYLWLVDAASGQKTLLAPQPGSESVAFGEAKFSRDGKGIFLSTDQGSEFQRLAYLDLATQAYPVLTNAIPLDIDEVDLSPDGPWIACV